MNRPNFDAMMQDLLDRDARKRLLLHSCCAPCSSYCLEQVAPHMRTTVFYYNPNLDSREEYEKRKGEQIRLLSETGLADFLDCDYHPEDFARVAAGLEEAEEGGARCVKCFELRLQKTAEAAKAGGFDYFGTTLTVSPLKNAEMINRIGFALAERLGVNFLPSDFKKRGGYLRSVELSREHNLYRQNYCGCVYSKRRLSKP